MAGGAEYGDNLLKTYIDMMQTRVFDPIGMSTATFSTGSPEGGYLSIRPNSFNLPFQFVEGDDCSMTMVIAGFIEAKKLAPVSGSENVNATLEVPFQLTVGQTAILEPEEPQLSFMPSVEFQAVEEDSRCPSDVVCVTPGRVMVKLSAQFDAAASGPQELTLEVGMADSDADRISGASGIYQIEASVLDPYPRTSVEEPPEFVVTLIVTKILN